MKNLYATRWLIFCLLTSFSSPSWTTAPLYYDHYDAHHTLAPEDIRHMTCAQCHGDDGSGYGPDHLSLSGPQIAGLSRGYLIRALREYQATPHHPPLRINDKMNAVVAQMPSFMFAVYAQMYSQLPPIKETTPYAHTASWSQGEALWTHGKPNKELAACMSCHGLHATGLPSLFPGLRHQKMSYLIDTLHHYQQGQRQGFRHMMPHIAQQLTEEEISALATYLSHP